MLMDAQLLSLVSMLGNAASAAGKLLGISNVREALEFVATAAVVVALASGPLKKIAFGRSPESEEACQRRGMAPHAPQKKIRFTPERTESQYGSARARAFKKNDGAAIAPSYC